MNLTFLGAAGAVTGSKYLVADLCQILLPDSGRLQEEEADYLSRHHASKHKPAHADAAPLVEWMGAGRRAPQNVFLTHGEPGPADPLRQRIQKALGWNASVTRMGRTVELTA